MKRLISAAAALMLTIICLFIPGCTKGEEKVNNLLKDAGFQSSLMLMRNGNSIGNLPLFDTEAERCWFVYQNNSRFVMKKESLKTDTATDKCYENEGKKIRVFKDTDGSWVMSYALYCDNEYETPRTQTSDPWVHLMFEQRFDEQLKPADYSSLSLSLGVRNDEFINHMTTDDYNPNIMCAQTNIYFILRNVNRASEDCDSFIWMGLTMYDDRRDIPIGSYMVDTGFDGATDTLIYCPNMSKYFTSSTHNGEWHDIDVDLISLVGESLAKAQAKNIFTNTEIADLAIQNFYISTEVSGNFTLGMSFRNLEMKGEKKSS